MVLHDCRTQRNLSDEGRAHARQVGEAFRAQGVPVAQVLSSPWCRCLETARLAFGVSPEVSTALNNLFGRSRCARRAGRPLESTGVEQAGRGQRGDGFARLYHRGADRRVARAGGDGDRHASGRRQVSRCRPDGSRTVEMTYDPGLDPASVWASQRDLGPLAMRWCAQVARCNACFPPDREISRTRESSRRTRQLIWLPNLLNRMNL